MDIQYIAFFWEFQSLNNKFKIFKNTDCIHSIFDLHYQSLDVHTVLHPSSEVKETAFGLA
jgi:hypothetical protein